MGEFITLSYVAMSILLSDSNMPLLLHEITNYQISDNGEDMVNKCINSINSLSNASNVSYGATKRGKLIPSVAAGNKHAKEVVTKPEIQFVSLKVSTQIQEMCCQRKLKWNQNFPSNVDIWKARKEYCVTPAVKRRLETLALHMLSIWRAGPKKFMEHEMELIYQNAFKNAFRRNKRKRHQHE